MSKAFGLTGQRESASPAGAQPQRRSASFSIFCGYMVVSGPLMNLDISPGGLVHKILHVIDSLGYGGTELQLVLNLQGLQEPF
jgi:hypothetical protein